MEMELDLNVKYAKIKDNLTIEFIAVRNANMIYMKNVPI